MLGERRGKCAVARDGLACARVEKGAFLTYPEVLVTYIQTPSPPAVGVRRRVRIRVSTNIMV